MIRNLMSSSSKTTSPIWAKEMSTKRNQPYYYNIITKESVWEKPEGCEIIDKTQQTPVKEDIVQPSEEDSDNDDLVKYVKNPEAIKNTVNLSQMARNILEEMVEMKRKELNLKKAKNQNNKDEESKVHKKATTDEVEPRCSRDNRRGGVVILAKESLKMKQLVSTKIDVLCQDKLFECSSARFETDKLSFLLVGIYKTPQFENSEFLIRLNNLFEFLISKGKYVIIMGDFNIDILKNTNESKELKNILLRNGMKYLIDFPTRVTATSKTCIGNIITNISMDQLKVEGVVTALSDHDGQIIELMNFQKQYK
ncbi:uncharacterized protein LOC124357090 [Homalodisca vitripennis]|uniref:uncharacterized protein LOC124357090 n=1 Tax=Homalodisca vitripennis TaxID=197043 RepID=UPI001EEB3A71|nr:uncharacterized protein LOC124357090 [Homalodisca vitripennis]